MMEKRTLGGSELEVSGLSLGSWRTFQRLGRDQALAVMGAARELGFNFLDDARYDDETGSAPMPTGHSGPAGELFRAAGWDRAATVAPTSCGGSSGRRRAPPPSSTGRSSRMGFEYVDLIDETRLRIGLAIDELVAAMGELVASGRRAPGGWSTGRRDR